MFIVSLFWISTSPVMVFFLPWLDSTILYFSHSLANTFIPPVCLSPVSRVWLTPTLNEPSFLFTRYLCLALLVRVTIRQNSSPTHWWLPTPILLECLISLPNTVSIPLGKPKGQHSFFFFSWNTLNLPLVSGPHGFFVSSCLSGVGISFSVTCRLPLL